MTPSDMKEIIQDHCHLIAEDGPVLEFIFKETNVLLVYDEQADRMRLISAIANLDQLEEGMIEEAMQANFHSVLDARYAISDDIIWSAFMHPLSSLDHELFFSAIEQVTMANMTFGEGYQGSPLFFGG